MGSIRVLYGHYMLYKTEDNNAILIVWINSLGLGYD